MLQVTVLMQALAFSEFAWLWISTKAWPVCRVTVMQLNAKGPGCKSTGSRLLPQLADPVHNSQLTKNFNINALPFEKVLRFRQARLPTTPFGHAFRPRLSATPSGHVFRRAIRIEDVMLHGRTGCTTDFSALCSAESSNCAFTCC